ncbi:hypothetical protein [Rhodoblastus sp.]|uniref:hypothetical protein n=1 Tax=Rhodoblastus sp. TaxID=1962975 RepID=UPI003F9E502B
MGRHVSDDKKATYLIGAGKLAKLAEHAAEESQSVLEYFAILRSALFYQLDRLAAADDHSGVAAMAAQLTTVLKEIARITGQVTTIANSTVINVQNNVHILNSAPFADLQAGLLQVCAAHPAARADIVALFKSLNDRYSGHSPKLINVTTAKEAARV